MSYTQPYRSLTRLTSLGLILCLPLNSIWASSFEFPPLIPQGSTPYVELTIQAVSAPVVFARDEERIEPHAKINRDAKALASAASATPEIVDIVDELDHVIGQIVKDEAHRTGAQHRGITVLFIDPRNGNICFQRRAPNKKTYANRWDVSVGGHVKSGSHYRTTVNDELREESPIPIDASRLIPVKTEGFFEADVTDPAIGHNRERKTVWIVLLTPTEVDDLLAHNTQLEAFWRGYVPQPGGQFTSRQENLVHQKMEAFAHQPLDPLDTTRLGKYRAEAEAYFEVAGFRFIPLSQAVTEYEEDPSRYADGFFSLFGKTYPNGIINPNANRYEAVLKQAIGHALDEGMPYGAEDAPIHVEFFRGGKPGSVMSDIEPVALADPATGMPLRQSMGRLEVHETNQWHQVVHVYIFDTRGRILLQRRNWTLRVSPGRLQVAVSGHVDLKDIEHVTDLMDPAWVLDVAQREGLEELGRRLDRSKLQLVSRINEVHRQEPGNYEFATILKYVASDQEIAAWGLSYDTNEVDELALLPGHSLEQDVRLHPARYSGSIRYLMTHYPSIYNRLLETPPTEIQHSHTEEDWRSRTSA